MQRLLFGGGIVAIALFDIVWLIDGLLQPGYSHVTMYVSDLAFYPNGWILDVTFVVSGFLLVGFSYGLLRFLRQQALAALAAIVAVGFIGSGLFPETPAHDPSRPHTIIASIAFAAMVANLFVAAVRWRRSEQWHGLAAYSRVAAPAALALLTLLLLAAPEGSVIAPPLRPWLGLIQRAFLVPWHLWVILVAARAFTR